MRKRGWLEINHRFCSEHVSGWWSINSNVVIINYTTQLSLHEVMSTWPSKPYKEIHLNHQFDHGQKHPLIISKIPYQD